VARLHADFEAMVESALAALQQRLEERAVAAAAAAAAAAAVTLQPQEARGAAA
jgi:hypothetical protein